MEWLGFCIDLVVGKYSVPISKINTKKARLLEPKQTQFLPAKQVASLIGTTMSMFSALQLVARLMTRSLYAILNDRISWCHQLALIEETLLEKLEIAF